MIESEIKELIGKYNEAIYVEGKEEPGDGGGGYFVWDEPPKEEDNTGEIPIDDYREESEYILEPIIEELTAYNVYEHQPLNYYKYGEYPRFQMPIVNRCRYKTIKRKKTK